MTDFTTTPAFENATDTTDAPIEQFFSQAQNAPVLDNAALHIDSEELDSDVEALTISLDTAAETSPVQDDAESEPNTEAFAALGLTPVLLKYRCHWLYQPNPDSSTSDSCGISGS